MRMTSGSWRRTRRRPSMYDSVSIPTSRWLTMQPQSSWTNSIGSSIVTMWCFRLRLIELIIDASVVDFPEPVAPVTRTRPRCSFASSFDALRQPQLLEARNLLGDEAEGERDRAPLPVAVDAEAADAVDHVGRVQLSVCVEALALRRCELGDERMRVSRSLSVSSRSSSGISSPSTRAIAGEATLRCRSLPPSSMSSREKSVQIHGALAPIGGPSEASPPLKGGTPCRHLATMAAPGGVPERPKGTGCKPVGSAFRGSNPLSPMTYLGGGARRQSRAEPGSRTLLRTRTCARWRGRPCGPLPSSARSFRPGSCSSLSWMNGTSCLHGWRRPASWRSGQRAPWTFLCP